ncbi:MAG: hypothetical protein DCC67_18990 [Planctomycetota bacterium]|nr:MAG: hypothetical protein DCC67_18990 [Planctomycetota bacterium]
MKVHHRRFKAAMLALAASQVLAAATCTAQLLPPGDFQGKPLAQWGLDWAQWSIATGLGGAALPDTVGGVRYLPPNFGGGDFVANLTVPQGTALVVDPFFVFGERYDNGTEDNPADPFIDTILEQTTIKTTLDGNVVLEGAANAFPDRKFGVTVLPQPILYAEPQPRGPGLNSVAALFGVGVATIFAPLPLGEHTIRNEFNSSVFGASSFTYNITVVPEPASLIQFGVVLLGAMAARRGRAG